MVHPTRFYETDIVIVLVTFSHAILRNSHFFPTRFYETKIVIVQSSYFVEFPDGSLALLIKINYSVALKGVSYNSPSRWAFRLVHDVLQ